MNQKERMIAGLPYKYSPELSDDLSKGRDFCFRYNNISPIERENRKEMINQFFCKTGDEFSIQSPQAVDKCRNCMSQQPILMRKSAKNVII